VARRAPAEKSLGTKIVESAQAAGSWVADTAKDLVDKGASLIKSNESSGSHEAGESTHHTDTTESSGASSSGGFNGHHEEHHASESSVHSDDDDDDDDDDSNEMGEAPQPTKDDE